MSTRYIVRVATVYAVIVFICIVAMVNDAAGEVANKPPTIGFVEPLPIDVVANRAFKVCAYVKDLEGDPLKVIFTPQRSTLLSVSLAKANKCAWFAAPEKRGLDFIKIQAYEIDNPRNRSSIKVELCILMDELYLGAADPVTTYCPRI